LTLRPPIGELIYDLEHYCRQEGLDPLLILSVMRIETKERKPMHNWREKICRTKEWMKNKKMKQEQDPAACMDNEKAHSYQMNRR
jgi:hypothetical protein